jgi:hypothetical protein
LGDYQEIFDRMCATQGLFKAYGWLIRQTVVSVFLFISDWFLWRGNMLINNFKMTFRTFFRHKTFTFINVLGLAMGLSCTLLILLWVQNEISYDRFLKNGHELYIATYSNGSIVTPPALSDYLKSHYPEVVHSSSVQKWDTFLKYNDLQNQETGGLFVEPEFLDMFSFQFIEGQAETALNDPYSIVISERIARKYFGNEKPVGKTLLYSSQVDLKVTGVFKNHPRQSHIEIEYMLPLAIFKNWGRDLTLWKYNELQTYVQLQPSTDLSAFNRKITDVVQKHHAEEKRPLALQSVLRMHLYHFSQPGGLITYVYIFSSLALFILYFQKRINCHQALQYRCHRHIGRSNCK